MGQVIPQPVVVEFERIDCFKCAIPFWVPTYFRRERLEKHDSFFCPAGHEQHYIGKTEAEKEAERLRKMLENANRQSSNLLSELTVTQQDKKKLERKLKRVDRGVCPECNRTFSNLARHMACKHKP